MNNKLEFGVSPEGQGSKEFVAGIRKYQQEKYSRQDLPLLEALGFANLLLTSQYNLDEENN
jgi:hypothetical protein